MTAVKDILNIGLIAQSGALAKANFDVSQKKRVKAKDLIGAGVGSIVGIKLIGVQSNIIAGL